MSAAAVAEAVQSTLGNRLDTDEEHYGSGTGSPCSTSSRKVLTSACAVVVQATGQDAQAALHQIQGHPGFATLRATAGHINSAARQYQRLGCAVDPADATARQDCLASAAVVAQGFSDLRDGITLGLAGR